MERVQPKWSWYWGIWALMGLYMASWDLAMYPSASIFRMLVLNLLQNATWGLLGLFLLWLANRRPIETLAEACGLPNQAHFYKLFRAAFGVPPAEWRRSVRGAFPPGRPVNLAPW